MLDWGDGAVVGGGKTFDGGDLGVGYGAYGNDATADGFAVDVDGAGAAGGNAAAEFGAGELEFITKNPKEWGVGFDVEVVGDAIDGEADGHGMASWSRYVEDYNNVTNNVVGAGADSRQSTADGRRGREKL